MLHKSFEILETKADGDSGTFEALVSVFNNVDSVGDRILPGAYAKTLDRRRASGDPLPIIFSHKWDDPMAHIGIANPNDVVETEKGLWVKAQLDLDNPLAAQVYRLMKRRSMNEMSIGYRVPRGGEKRASNGVNEISEIDLVEAGPTLKGVNGETELAAVKSALEEIEPADEATLRKQSAEVERGLIEQQLPEVVEAEEVEPEPSPEFEAVRSELAEVKQGLADLVEAQNRRSEEDLRREASKVERDLQREQLPESEPEEDDGKAEGALDAALAHLRTLAEGSRDAGEAEAAETLVGVLEGLQAGETSPQALSVGLSAVWSAAFINNLPDAAFLHVESGGSKDSDGKTTPRTLRHFPYKDASGIVDLPHLRNALSRIPQSNLSQSVKDRLAAQAQKILDGQKSSEEPSEKAEVTDREPAAARSVDPLRKRSQETVLEVESGGLSKRKPPKVKHEPEPEQVPESELRRRSRELMLELLTGANE